MKKLQDLNPEFSKSILIRFAVRAAAKQGLVIEFENPNIEHTTIGSSKEKQKKESKEDWCKAFGGEVKNGVCYIDKYEKTVSGHVVKQPRVIPISAFPIDRDEFRRDIIQNEETLEDAIANWKKKPLDY